MLACGQHLRTREALVVADIVIHGSKIHDNVAGTGSRATTLFVLLNGETPLVKASSIA